MTKKRQSVVGLEIGVTGAAVGIGTGTGFGVGFGSEGDVLDAYRIGL